MVLPDRDGAAHQLPRWAARFLGGHLVSASIYEVTISHARSAPLRGAAVSARIRWQGVRLYRRGLPVIPRPAHLSQEGVR
jgi:DUF1365 family protein